MRYDEVVKAYKIPVLPTAVRRQSRLMQGRGNSLLFF